MLASHGTSVSLGDLMVGVRDVCVSRDVELEQFNGQAGYDAVLPLLQQAEASLREELRRWTFTLQQARNAYPHLCRVPTRRLWVLAEAFGGNGRHKDAFFDLMRGLSRTIPLTDDLLTGLRLDPDASDRHHATVMAVGARVQEIMAAHPPPPPRSVLGLGARHFRRAAVASRGARDDDVADGGEVERKRVDVAVEGQADEGEGVHAQPPRVLNGSVQLVATPTKQVRQRAWCCLCARRWLIRI